MNRFVLVLVLVLVLVPSRARAHVGSPDVFFEGDAGPYQLFVTVRVPQVIPGVATIEVRASTPDIDELTVVPMRLTGPGSELPPVPDAAQRSPADPQFFTADLWLMEHGSLQVKIDVRGARGTGTVRVPVPAVALATRTMDRGLGTLLFALMLVLALALVAIAAAAVREGGLPAGGQPDARARRRTRIAAAGAGAIVIAVLVAGNAWWNVEAATYAGYVQKPWHVAPRVDGCTLSVAIDSIDLLPDHGHDMHLFLVRAPELDRLAHLHPDRTDAMHFATELPSLPAGHYRLYADIVLASGFPITGTTELELPDLTCAPVTGDDSTWAGDAKLPDGLTMTFDRPEHLRAGDARPLRFHVAGGELEPYMGMAAHAEILRRDGAVFAHIHPTGSVAMPALDLVAPMDHMMAMPERVSPELAFPFGFPSPGDYRMFVQVKHAGQVVTGVFDAHVE